MGLFGGPNVDKLAAKRDLKGLAKAVVNSDPQVRAEAARALGEIDDPAAVPFLVDQLSGQQDEEVIESGAAALRAMGDTAVPVLAKGLREADDDKRPAYSALLGRMGEAYGQVPLIEATRDGGPAVRGTAAFGLGLIGTPEATQRIIEVFESDPDMDARGLAALALGTRKLPGAYETFVAAIEGPDPVNRALSATCLGMIGDARAVPKLQLVADVDQDERVQDAARRALADLPSS